MKFILGLMFLLNMSMIHAHPQSVSWYTQGADKQVKINVDLFLSSTCPHCIKADAFFREIEKEKPWVVVHRYVINQDKLALQTFYERLQQQNSTSFSVPAIFFCESRWTGFRDASTTGDVLMNALTYCRKKISQQGELSTGTITVLQKGGNASDFQYSGSLTQSAPLLIITTALMDAMSPCSFFCFAAFLAFLWLYPTKKWLQFSLGIFFIVSLAVIHYVQQVHSIFYYQMIPKLKLFEIFVGIGLFLVVLNMYRKTRFRMIVKPSAAVFGLAILTVFAIHVAQQTCVFNVSMILEQWWAEHPPLPAMQLLYQIIYQFFYVVPLVLLLLLCLIVGRRQWIGAHQQSLTMAAYLLLMSIGVILLVYPQLLANMLLSITLPLVAIIGGRLMTGIQAKN